jgi:hypothetical protein
MKALRRALDPQDLEISLDDDASTFSARCRLADADARALRALVQGRLATAPGWVAALAMR